MGNSLWEAREANPRGFFEDREINEINEDLLESVMPGRPQIFGRSFFRSRPVKWQRWLACLPLDVQIMVPDPLGERIGRMVEHQPYCFKDPRFSYTLPAWRPYLTNTVFLCVFRDPATTATSIVKECREVPHLAHKNTGIRMSFRRALEIWASMYQAILWKHSKEGSWLFLHYNQVLQEEGLDRIEEFTCAKIDRAFPTSTLSRSTSVATVPLRYENIYRELCEVAGFQIP